jgi:hypothetical protein
MLNCIIPSFFHSIYHFAQIADRIAIFWAEFPPKERLARSVNTMKILPDYMKRAPDMSPGFPLKLNRENRH